MTPREVVRRAPFSRLGLSIATLEGCSADGGTSAGGVVEGVPSATGAEATPHASSSSHPRTPIKPAGVVDAKCASDDARVAA